MRRVLLLLFSHRFLALARWEFHFLWVRARNAVTGQRKRIHRRLAQGARPMLLNIGAGPRGLDHPNWVNIDGFGADNVHFLVDCLRPLPFPDGAFDGIFSEHVLEHFTQEDGEQLVRELFRILKPQGSLRVIVPDAQFVLRSYFDCPAELIEYRGSGGDTAMEAVNSFFRQRYEHQFMYDWQTLRKLFKQAGFSEIVQSGFGREAFNRALVLDDPKYEKESLYVEARKA